MKSCAGNKVNNIITESDVKVYGKKCESENQDSISYANPA